MGVDESGEDAHNEKELSGGGCPLWKEKGEASQVQTTNETLNEPDGEYPKRCSIRGSGRDVVGPKR